MSDNLNPKAGLGRMVTSIANGLHNNGHEIGFVISSGETKHNSIKVNFRFRKLNFYNNIIDLFRIRKFVREYDVIICYDVKPAGILAWLATLGLSSSIIVHSIGTYSLFEKNKVLKNKIIEKVFSESDRIFIINDFVKRKIEESKENFCFGDNASIVPVGVDSSLFHIKNKLANDESLGQYIVTVGALKPRKGQLDSIKAFETIKDIYPDLKYVLVGSVEECPDYYGEIRKFIEVCSLEKRIIFLQNISDKELITIYRNALFFIMTSTSTEYAIEGFGMVYIEAALCGITAIGSSDTGAEAAIINGETGLLVEEGDINQIARAMDVLLRDEDLRNKLSYNAGENALTYDWKYVVDLYESELANLII
ncbi:MAG: glycosyltransferase family 4 protein [Bdellovibrionales bacterium]|nr:glycosyltransferase family 4 protein [Bdellovibrionales bacterium]